MKLTLVILAVIGLTCAAPHTKTTRGLHEDLQDFLALIPRDEIIAIALDYLANDPEVQHALEYLQSDEFEKIVVTVDSQPETISLLDYLEASGLGVYNYLNNIHDLLGIPHIPQGHAKKAHGTRTIRQLIDDIKAILPIDALKALYHEKLETSPDFKALIDRLSSAEFHNLVLKIKALPEVQDLVARLRELGIDVDAVVEFFKNLFGWTGRSARSTRGLHEDFQDFLALIPRDEIIAIALDYLANDAEVQHALEYLQSDEFEKIVVTVDSQPETISLLDYLEASGLAAYDFLNGIHELLGIPLIPHGHAKKAHGTRTIRQLIDDIKAILPIEALKALYHEKLETSPDFKALIDRLSSAEFHNLVLKIKALPEVQDLVARLRELGIDVDAVVEFFKNLFGWTGRSARSTRGLHEDFQDFLALIPRDEIIAIALDYLANDAEVQHALEYLQSDEFEKIVVTVDSQPETISLLDYLEASGLAAYDFLNGIHELLGIPLIPHGHAKKAHGTRTIRQLIDDIKAILPIEALKALYHEKLETSPDFKALIDRLSSAEFHNLVLKIKALPEVQDLVARLRELGIDVDAVVEFFKNLFGWTGRSARSTRGLHEDLQDFLALIPRDEIIAIALDYLANDAEVQHALEYLQSDEFEKIVVTVDSQPETISLLDYLEASGLAAYDFLNGIHELLGIPLIPHGHAKKAHGTRTIRQLIDDIKAILPIEALKALYHEKLETSPDFKALIDRLSSAEFHNLVLKIKALPEVQDLVARLRELGIDVDAIVEFFKSLFGWTGRSARSTRGLHEDLQDFLALIPRDEIIAIALDYLANDAEVQHALEYLQSDEFEKIVVTVDSQPETISLLDYLEASGLAAYDFLNGIHELLGIPLIPHGHAKKAHGTRTIRQLIDDIKAILPIEALKALYHEKLETSPDFKALIDRLSSAEFHNLVLKIKALPEVQDLVARLRELGIDVDAIVEFFKTLFGWTH